MKPRSQEKYLAAVKMFQSKKKIGEIAQELGLSREVVRLWIKNAGIYEIRTQRWTAEDKEFLKQNYELLGPTGCSLKINKTVESVWDMARQLKLRLSKNKRLQLAFESADKNRSHIVNRELFFNINTPEVAYILGILWADGSLRNGKGGGNDIRLVLKAEDMDNIINIFNKTGSWGYKKWVHNQNKNLVSKLFCCDKPLYDHLSSLDYKIKSYASASKVLGRIPEHLRHYWWRGYFDGDGCISKNARSMCITSTVEQDWSFLNFLPENLKRNVKRGGFTNSKNGKLNQYSRFILYQKDSRLFFQYIYQGDTFGFKRKRDIFLESLSRF